MVLQVPPCWQGLLEQGSVPDVVHITVSINTLTLCYFSSSYHKSANLTLIQILGQGKHLSEVHRRCQSKPMYTCRSRWRTRGEYTWRRVGMVMMCRDPGLHGTHWIVTMIALLVHCNGSDNHTKIIKNKRTHKWHTYLHRPSRAGSCSRSHRHHWVHTYLRWDKVSWHKHL